MCLIGDIFIKCDIRICEYFIEYDIQGNTQTKQVIYV